MTPLPSIHPAICIGSDTDAHILYQFQRSAGHHWRRTPAPGWAIVHAAKSPWHRDMVGYQERAAPPGPEQYVARRDRRMALNLVDMDRQDPKLILPVLNQASDFITEMVDEGLSVLVHCNMGLSRSPATVLWWMHLTVPEQPHEEALAALLADHPFTRRDSGIMALVREQWALP